MISNDNKAELLNSQIETKTKLETIEQASTTEPSASSSSFNSYVNSSNSSTSSSPSNNNNNNNINTNTNNTNHQSKKNHKTYNNNTDPLLNAYQSNYYNYFVPPQMFGFPFTDLNSYINPYLSDFSKTYNQQIFNYSNYPTYFPAEFRQNWQTSTNYSKENSRTNKVLNQNNNNSNLNSNSHLNLNQTNGQKRESYTKKYYKNKNETKKEEDENVKPVIKPYDLMVNEKVYSEAYPALGSLEKTCAQKTTNEDKNVNEKLTETANLEDNKENEANKINKKWSEIVTGRNLFFNNDLEQNFPIEPTTTTTTTTTSTTNDSNNQNTDNNDKIEDTIESINKLELNNTNNNTDEAIKSDNNNNNNNNNNTTDTNSQTKSKSNKKYNSYNKNYNNFRLNNFQNQLAFDMFYNTLYNYNYNVNQYQTNQVYEFDKTVLDKYNPSEFFHNGEKEGAKECKFYVIKSNSREDVLHSIKHGIWCSTKYGNTKLDQAYQEAQNHKHMSIYLFFSINTSGMFCGMAEMVSRVDFDYKSEFWSQDKWKGKFEIKWVYIKDVPNSKLKHIILPNNENKPVTHSRDTQEIPFEFGVEMLNVFRNFNHTSTIFDESENMFNSNNLSTNDFNFMTYNNYNQPQYTKYSNYTKPYNSSSSYKSKSEYKKVNNSTSTTSTTKLESNNNVINNIK